MTKELMVVLASTLSMEHIADKIAENCVRVQADPEDNEAITGLSFYCHIFIMNQVTKGSVEKAMDVLKEMDEHDRLKKLVQTSPN